MRHRYAGKRRRSVELQAAQQPAALRPTAKMAICRKYEKATWSTGAPAGPECGHFSRDQGSTGPRSTSLPSRQAVARAGHSCGTRGGNIPEHIGTWSGDIVVHASVLPASMICVEPCASSCVQRGLCSRPSAGEVTAHGGDDDNLIVGQHESAKTRVPYKSTQAHTRSEKGTIDSDTAAQSPNNLSCSISPSDLSCCGCLPPFRAHQYRAPKRSFARKIKILERSTMMLKQLGCWLFLSNFARSKTQTLLSGPSQRDDAAGVLGP